MNSWIPIAARLIIGTVLLIAGIGKLRSRTWPVLAVEMGTPKAVVVTLPAIESMLGIALILQLGGAVLAWPAIAMFAVFTVVVTSRYARGSALPCNCFGGEGPISRWTIVRNIALVALAVVGAF